MIDWTERGQLMIRFGIVLHAEGVEMGHHGTMFRCEYQRPDGCGSVSTGAHNWPGDAVDEAIRNCQQCEHMESERLRKAGRARRCPVIAMAEEWETDQYPFRRGEAAFALRQALELQAGLWRRIADDGEAAAPQIGTPFVSAKGLRMCARDLLGEP